MKFELNEIYTIKIVSGEEIIAKIVEQNDSFLTLSTPLSIAPNHQGIGLMPSMFTSDEDKNITLNTNCITMFAETSDAVRIKYIEATTGITTASKKIVLG